MKKRGIAFELITRGLLWCTVGTGAYGGFFVDQHLDQHAHWVTNHDRAHYYEDPGISEAAKASLEWTKNGYAGIMVQRLQGGGETMQTALRGARLAAARSFAAEYMLYPLSPRSLTMRALRFMKEKMAPAREQHIYGIHNENLPE